MPADYCERKCFDLALPKRRSASLYQTNALPLCDK
jgi:hypothetical protein